MKGGEATIKHKTKFIMINSKDENHLHWQLGHNFAWILVLQGCVEQALDLAEGKPDMLWGL